MIKMRDDFEPKEEDIIEQLLDIPINKLCELFQIEDETLEFITETILENYYYEEVITVIENYNGS